MNITTQMNLSKDRSVVRQKSGVDAYGLYLEFLEFKGDDDSGLVRQVKMLLVDRYLVCYERMAGRKCARWLTSTFADAETAVAKARAFVGRFGKSGRVVVPRTQPLLVEMTATDLDILAQGNAPHARYTGSFAVENILGKVDDTKATCAQSRQHFLHQVDKADTTVCVPPLAASGPVGPLEAEFKTMAGIAATEPETAIADHVAAGTRGVRVDDIEPF